MRFISKLAISIFTIFSVGCGGGSGSGSEKDVMIYQFDLNDSDHRWIVGFADYPAGEEVFYELSSEWKQLPVPLEVLNGINVSGNNHSDDLFMYIKRELSGLKPNTRYSLSFNSQIATNADSGCVGIGGAPGESVVVKVGATSYEPIANQQSQGSIRMNLDYGNQSVGGSDAIVVGNLANTQTDCIDNIYEQKDFDNVASTFEVFTEQEGTLWALFATDSGFEGTTSIYFTYLEIRAEEM